MRLVRERCLCVLHDTGAVVCFFSNLFSDEFAWTSTRVLLLLSSFAWVNKQSSGGSFWVWSGQPYFRLLLCCCSTLRGPQSSSWCERRVNMSLPLSFSWLRGLESSCGNRSHQRGHLAPDDAPCLFHTCMMSSAALSGGHRLWHDAAVHGQCVAQTDRPQGKHTLRLILLLFDTAGCMLMPSCVFIGAGDRRVKWTLLHTETRITQDWRLRFLWDVSRNVGGFLKCIK